MPKKMIKPGKKISAKSASKNDAIFSKTIRPKPAAQEATIITLRTDTGVSFDLPSSKKLEQAAMAWRSIVRNRRRWADAKSSREEQAQNAHRQLLDLLSVQTSVKEAEEKISQLAKANFIEVSVPFE